MNIIIYIFAIALAHLITAYMMEQRVPETSADETSDLMIYFGPLPKAGFTLFTSMVGSIDWENAVHPHFTIVMLSVMIWLIHIVFSSFYLMNVICGIFCQDAVEAS